MKAKEFIKEDLWDYMTGGSLASDLATGFSGSASSDASTDNNAGTTAASSDQSPASDQAPVSTSKYAGTVALKDPEFMPALEKVASNLGVKVTDLLGIMKLESSLDPSKVNPTSGATGLIQFMPKIAASLGTSTAALKNMSATEQLPYVEQYFRTRGVKPGMDIGDLYMIVFMPAHVNKDDNYVISKSGQQVYNQNRGLDASKDGVLTVADIKQSANRFG